MTTSTRRKKQFSHHGPTHAATQAHGKVGVLCRSSSFFRTVGSFGVFLVFWATHVPPSSRYSFDLYQIALYLKHICIWTSFCTLTSCGEEISIASDCALEEKVNVEGFTQYGCYDNQPKTLEVLFDSIDVNNSCSFTTRFDFLISCRFVSLYAIN